MAQYGFLGQRGNAVFVPNIYQSIIIPAKAVKYGLYIHFFACGDTSYGHNFVVVFVDDGFIKSVGQVYRVCFVKAVEIYAKAQQA